MRHHTFIDYLTQTFLPMRRLGWAFLLAWVFCIFYTDSLTGFVGNNATSAEDLSLVLRFVFSALPVLMSVVFLVIIVFSEKRIGSPTSHKSVFTLAPVCTAISTPLMFLFIDSPEVTSAIFIVGSILTGFGSACMWVMWGEYYSSLSQQEAERLAPVSAIIAALLVLGISSMSGWFALVLVSCFPLISGICFYLSWTQKRCELAEADEQPELSRSSSPLKALRTMGRSSVGILTACFFVCIVGGFWDDQQAGNVAFDVILLASIAGMAVVAFTSTIGPRRISISFLYRWMCPLLVIAFVTFVVFDKQTASFIACGISVAARFAFCLITQMYFARYASTHKATPVQSYGFGWIFVHLGDFFGVIAMLYINTLEDISSSLAYIASISIVALVIITMFVLNDERSFAVSRDDVGESDVSENSAPQREQVIEELSRAHGLTPREKEVFELLSQGRSIPYVRDALIISKETAATHAKHIYAKLNIHSRQELIDLVSENNNGK